MGLQPHNQLVLMVCLALFIVIIILSIGYIKMNREMKSDRKQIQALKSGNANYERDILKRDFSDVVTRLADRIGRKPTEKEILTMVFGTSEDRNRLWRERGIFDVEED